MSLPQKSSHHYCQLHHDSRDLTAAVERFAAEALRNGNAVVVVACPERVHELPQRLATRGMAPETVERLLTIIDSRELLATFMQDGMPDETMLRTAIEPVLQAAVSRGNGVPRVYGEMVNDLWHDGNARAAVELEALWNELLTEYRFVLFCGYVLDAFDPRSYGLDLEGICECHADVESIPGDEPLRFAIDEACREVIGFHVGSTLRQSQTASKGWESRLSLARQSVLWLQENASPRLLPVLNSAAALYARQQYGEDAKRPASASLH